MVALITLRLKPDIFLGAVTEQNVGCGSDDDVLEDGWYERLLARDNMDEDSDGPSTTSVYGDSPIWQRLKSPSSFGK